MPNFESAVTGGPATFGDEFVPIRTVGRWPEIDPSLVEDSGGIAPALTLDLLPLPWRTWTADTARGAGAPVDYVMQSLLAAVSGICGVGVTARITPAWNEPLVLWLALVGRRSTGKSPAVAPVRTLLGRLEAELKESDTNRVPRLVVTDTCRAVLTDALEVRPQGLLMWRDEASSWIGDLPEPATQLSVLGSIQPDQLVQAFAIGHECFAPISSTLGPIRRPTAGWSTVARPTTIMPSRCCGASTALPARPTSR